MAAKINRDTKSIMAEATVTREIEDRPDRQLSALTVAGGLLLLVGVLAVVLRLANLSAVPLSPEEAQEALAVWRFWQPESSRSTFDYSPAYFSLTSLLMLVLGDGDAIMRLVPALFGAALALLPWFWRRYLGVTGALTASVLLAISPAATIAARTAGGSAIALTSVLLLLIAWTCYLDEGRRRWLVAAFAALAMGLASAPLFLSGLATAGLAWLVQARIGPRLPPRASTNGWRLRREHVRSAAVAGGALFLGLATMLFLNPGGLGAAGSVVGAWLSRFGLPASLLTWLSPVLAFGRYELAVLLPGTVAIFWASWQGKPLPVFLVYWFAAGLVLTLLQPGIVENALLLALPGALLVGHFVKDVFRLPAGESRWAVLLAVLVLGTVAFVNFARYLRLTPQSTAAGFGLLTVVALGMLVVAINFVRTWDGPAALQGTLVGALVLLILYGWGTAWWLGQAGANDPRERWVTVGTDQEVLLLQETIAETAWQTVGAGQGAEILAAVEHPVLRWYLRDFENVQMGAMTPPEARTRMMITPASEEEPPTGSDYFGSDFGLLHTGAARPEGTQRATLAEVLRWWLFHESPETIQGQRVILWVRNDAQP